MMTIKRYHAWRSLWLFKLSLAVSLLFLTAGCMKNYGRFTLDAQVKQTFQKGASQPGYRYFYTGREGIPYAIIGIDKGYTVPSKLWIAFEPQPSQLKKKASHIYYSEHDNPYGAHIVSPSGEIIGVWYSNVYNRSVKVDQENRTVEILYKNPELDRTSAN